MATTELQLSERQPILSSSEEVALSNPVVTVETNTTTVRK